MKQLKDMSLEELWQLFPIILKDHNPNYKVWYEEEKIKLSTILKNCGICRINHIGSTAVKGLIAKPIIDILLEMPKNYNVSTVTALLQPDDWILMAKNDAENTLDFNKGYTPTGFAQKVFHLHVKPYGDWGELYFRDFLEQHPDTARQYEALKLELNTHFEHNRDGYTNAKSNFITKYTEKARQEFPGQYVSVD